MNFIFWRNVLSALFIVAFVLDLIFGNGVESWRHWIAGAAFLVSVDDLISTFEKYRVHGRISEPQAKTFQHVLSVLIIGFFIYDLVSDREIIWRDWFIGVGFAFALRNLALTSRERSRR
ncbi:MAG: hypothetical protein IKP64_14280 [Selenomonadaceae bacterium]|nr:hypothetical protein [Selenomonadaceae bacterium]MBR4384710.1 hypothetical protein [Selenomonadaceae bacterium]